MQQVLQSLKTGETILEDIPCPKNNSKSLLVETRKTLVSAGTERMLMDFGKANLLGKIKQQPDKVKMVLDKVKTDGIATTLEAVKSKLEQPISLGYCNVGCVLEVGSEISGFTVGDRVVSNGHHAEIVRVPKNLSAKIPDNVADEEAVFTVLGAIALQGLRLSQPTLGESYVVIGLGLIGLLTVQLLIANGCRVLGVDFDESKCQLAKQFGAQVVRASKGEDLLSSAERFSYGRGVDAVLITAATKSNEPLHQAATMCRQRGRIVLVGVIGSEFSRADFYKKELSFQVSCSYGPGRYDLNYEGLGQDYPIGFVRWTEQRNFEAVLEMMSLGKLNVRPLISHNYDIKQAQTAYSELGGNSTLGILLNYPVNKDAVKDKLRASIVLEHKARAAVHQLSVGFIGAGNYGARMLAPAFKATGVHLESIVSEYGVSGKLTAKKTGFSQALTDANLVYSNPAIDIVVIATRHHLHADQVISSLNANKHVFVEKPLALTINELEQIKLAYEKSENKLLMLGFNRRFAPQIKTIKRLLLTDSSPKSFVMTVNAGMIPGDHWTQNSNIGGGRIIGEACHFIDLLRYLSGSKIVAWHAAATKSDANSLDDKVMITLSFADGSCGAIHYLANGHKALPKERLEVFCNGKVLQLDNFRKLKGFGWKAFKKQNLHRQNKGQSECVQAFVDAISQEGVAPISFDEILEVSRITIDVADSLGG